MLRIKDKGVYWKKAVNDTLMQAICCPVEWRYLSKCLLFLLACHSWKSSWYPFHGSRGTQVFSVVLLYASNEIVSAEKAGEILTVGWLFAKQIAFSWQIYFFKIQIISSQLSIFYGIPSDEVHTSVSLSGAQTINFERDLGSSYGRHSNVSLNDPKYLSMWIVITLYKLAPFLLWKLNFMVR